MSEHYLKKLPKITTLVFDVDGVLTDGSITLMPDGEMIRTLNTKDGFAMKQAAKAGLRMIAITRGSSQIVKDSLLRLGFEDVALNIIDKLDKYDEYRHIYDLQEDEVLYMGDDLPDLEVMREVGLPTCPKDAVKEVRDECVYISPFDGGRGCVRDVIEKVMRAKEMWSL
ncbi:3-deoxy-D-manno-octulosonate 8-phosphate phosphatase [Salibacter sp.]|jgi:3-deoxy-D-manno-octulosonate 8-phosphate phosphatase (KDO 8-P phosphatase)|uniref:KdsC family phosphatase n=2 Tax=Salibacter sp. TaxID=2010995 RepID=UPI002870A97B|nr:3-deoxy-D-manno-octulosonate 8-phosphate phosphatase [Salibacter sp.]MDR9488439.1 3-deoxy-D-manno-octulosonate 8-phosphate phosphatase [Salibacter sp.]